MTPSRSGRARTTTWAASRPTSGARRSSRASTPRASAGAAAAEWALTHTTVAVPEGAVSDAERDLRELLDRAEGERPAGIRDEMASTMHENFGVFRREEQMRRESEI